MKCGEEENKSGTKKNYWERDGRLEVRVKDDRQTDGQSVRQMRLAAAKREN